MRGACRLADEIHSHRASLEWGLVMKGTESDVLIARGAGAGTRPEESTAPADDSPVKNGRRLQHAGGASRPFHSTKTREPQPRVARIRGNHRVDQTEAAARFMGAPEHEKMHDDRLWDLRSKRDGQMHA